MLGLCFVAAVSMFQSLRQRNKPRVDPLELIGENRVNILALCLLGPTAL